MTQDTITSVIYIYILRPSKAVSPSRRFCVMYFSLLLACSSYLLLIGSARAQSCTNSDLNWVSPLSGGNIPFTSICRAAVFVVIQLSRTITLLGRRVPASSMQQRQSVHAPLAHLMRSDWSVQHLPSPRVLQAQARHNLRAQARRHNLRARL